MEHDHVLTEVEELTEDLEQEREYRRQVEDDNKRLRELLEQGIAVDEWEAHRAWCALAKDAL